LLQAFLSSTFDTSHTFATYIRFYKMRSAQFFALAMAVATSEAVSQGFNYGATKGDGSVRTQADFETEFRTAKNLVNTDHAFTSARLYTMIQGGSTNSPIEAIPAAIKEKTELLLGLWASGGTMANEIAALKSAISTYGDDFTKLVVGISVGSEDLYRNSAIGAGSSAGPGLEASELVDYINQVRSAISGTSLSGAPIGHVDTWNAWTNGSNAAAIEAVDWLGFDGYPYFENTKPNSIDDAEGLFQTGVNNLKAAAGNKEVWITETGWPVSGEKQGEAVANVANAKQYWDEVACPLFGNTNTWWYILADAGASPSFGISDSDSNTTPLFDLSCKSATSSAAFASGTPTASVGEKAGSGAASATGTSGASSGSGASGSGSSSGASSSSGSGSGSGAGAGAAGSSAAHSFTAVPSGTRPSTTPKAKSSSASVSASASASGAASTSSSGSSSGSSGSGSSGSGSSGSGSGASGSDSGSGTSSSTSASSTPSFNSAGRVTGSAFGALIGALALAFTF
jgi:glucan endo-1,3-beta-D-glucosidase